MGSRLGVHISHSVYILIITRDVKACKNIYIMNNIEIMVYLYNALMCYNNK